MADDEERRRQAFTAAVTDYPAYYLSRLHPPMKRGAFVQEITQELRAAAVDARVTGMTVAIVYEYDTPAVTQPRLLTAEEA